MLVLHFITVFKYVTCKSQLAQNRAAKEKVQCFKKKEAQCFNVRKKDCWNRYPKTLKANGTKRSWKLLKTFFSVILLFNCTQYMPRYFEAF